MWDASSTMLRAQACSASPKLFTPLGLCAGQSNSVWFERPDNRLCSRVLLGNLPNTSPSLKLFWDLDYGTSFISIFPTLDVVSFSTDSYSLAVTPHNNVLSTDREAWNFHPNASATHPLVGCVQVLFLQYLTFLPQRDIRLSRLI